MRRERGATQQQGGFSLVELMIALLSGPAADRAVIIAVYLEGKNNFVQDEAISRVQENGRFALRLLSREIAMGGFYGGVTDPTSITSPAVSDCKDRATEPGSDRRNLQQGRWWRNQRFQQLLPCRHHRRGYRYSGRAARLRPACDPARPMADRLLGADDPASTTSTPTIPASGFVRNQAGQRSHSWHRHPGGNGFDRRCLGLLRPHLLHRHRKTVFPASACAASRTSTRPAW